MNELKQLLMKSSEVTRRTFATRAAQAFMGVGIGTAVAESASAIDPRLRKAIEAAKNGKKASTATKKPEAAKSTESTESTESTQVISGGGKAQSVIYFYMGGGMSHLDTFDTKPGASTQGPTKTISTKADGVTISEHFPELAKQAKDIAFVNSLSSVQGAHEQGNYLMHTSYSPRGTIKHPCLGSWAVKMKGKMNPNLPGFVLVGGGGRAVTSGYFENKYGPAPVGNPRSGLQNSKIRISDKEFRERLQLADTYDKAFRGKYNQKQVDAYTDLYREAIQLLNGEDIKAFNIAEEPQKVFQDYGNSYIGQSCVLARRLVEAKTRFCLLYTSDAADEN